MDISFIKFIYVLFANIVIIEHLIKILILVFFVLNYIINILVPNLVAIMSCLFAFMFDKIKFALSSEVLRLRYMIVFKHNHNNKIKCKKLRIAHFWKMVNKKSGFSMII